MGQRDQSPPTHYLHDLQKLLDEPLALWLPEDVLAFAAGKAFARGFEPREAAVLICQEHSRRLCQRLVDDNEPASDLVEFAIANRIEGCAELASQMDQDLLDLLPDLPYFVRRPCFSAEFCDWVAHLAAGHGIPEHRWGVLEVQAGKSGRATA
jgi:hypothetical protein